MRGVAHPQDTAELLGQLCWALNWTHSFPDALAVVPSDAGVPIIVPYLERGRMLDVVDRLAPACGLIEGC